MLKKYLTYALHYAYIGLVVFVAIAVPMSSITAAERQFDAATADDGSAEAPAHTELDRGAPDPEEAPDNMTPSGPSCSQPAYLQSGPLIKTSETGGSENLDESLTSVEQLNSDSSCGHRLAVSLWQVSPSLGLQFTLIGAKPSGTS